MKPLYVTFAMAGFLLASPVGAQANCIGSGTSLCTLCTVPIVAPGTPDISHACGEPWVDLQAAFLIPSGPNASVHGVGCTGGLGPTRGGPPPNVALCCVRNRLPGSGPPC